MLTETRLSEGEQVFLVHGIQEGFRNDGRSHDDYRPMFLETGLLPNTSGSARIRLANTDILVGVKAEVEKPNLEKPDCGRIQFFIDCSANATPQFEGRGGEELASRIMSILSDAYNNSKSLDLKKLCILPKVYCWVIYVDVLLLEFGGNVCDAVSLGVKAALHDTSFPNVKMAQNAEKQHPDIELSDDRFDLRRLDIELNAPVVVTVNKIGYSTVVDPTLEEEYCTRASLMVGSTKDGTVTVIRQHGKGSLDPDSLTEMIETGLRVGKKLNDNLMDKLTIKNVDVTME